MKENLHSNRFPFAMDIHLKWQCGFENSESNDVGAVNYHFAGIGFQMPIMSVLGIRQRVG